MTAHRPLFGDFLPREVGVALCGALSVLASATFALGASALDRPADVPAIDKGPSIPVRITPVLDLDAPLLKLGGKRDRTKLPDGWIRRKPVPLVEEKAFVSTKAGKTEKDIPPPDMKIAYAGAPPPPDAAMAKEVDTLIVAVDAGPAASVDTPGSPDGVKDGTETDPLKARAVDLYRERIIASGNAVFDAGARAALESAKGDQIPPPPENYPDVVQSAIHLTFVCRKNRCD